MVVVLKPFNYLPWSSRPKKTFQHIFGLAPFGLKIFDLKIFGVEKFGLAAPSQKSPILSNTLDSDLNFCDGFQIGFAYNVQTVSEIFLKSRIRIPVKTGQDPACC